MADFEQLGVYACRILVPGLSEIYPIDDLEFENNSIANQFREAVLNLSDLDDEECTDLLETLNESNLADHRPVAGLIGLAADAGSFWSQIQGGVDVWKDVGNGVIKSVVFGFTVTFIALLQGFEAQPTPEGVANATTRTVVMASLTVLGLDFILTAMMFTI